jgi:sporulation protein YlmC with PRC-barrel domain
MTFRWFHATALTAALMCDTGVCQVSEPNNSPPPPPQLVRGFVGADVVTVDGKSVAQVTDIVIAKSGALTFAIVEDDASAYAVPLSALKRNKNQEVELDLTGRQIDQLPIVTNYRDLDFDSPDFHRKMSLIGHSAQLTSPSGDQNTTTRNGGSSAASSKRRPPRSSVNASAGKPTAPAAAATGPAPGAVSPGGVVPPANPGVPPTAVPPAVNPPVSTPPLVPGANGGLVPITPEEAGIIVPR